MKNNFHKIGVYYINQVHKILYLFEEEDLNGYRHVMKTINELEGASLRNEWMTDRWEYDLLLDKLNFLYLRMLSFDCEHQVFKNHVFESENLVNKLRYKEGLNK